MGKESKVKQKFELRFMLLWILNPIAILLYQNCTISKQVTIQEQIKKIEIEQNKEHEKSN